LGVGGRISAPLALVVRSGAHFCVAYHNHADWHILMRQRTLSRTESQAHEVLVACKEQFAHEVREHDARGKGRGRGHDDVHVTSWPSVMMMSLRRRGYLGPFRS